MSVTCKYFNSYLPHSLVHYMPYSIWSEPEADLGFNMVLWCRKEHLCLASLVWILGLALNMAVASSHDDTDMAIHIRFQIYGKGTFSYV